MIILTLLTIFMGYLAKLAIFDDSWGAAGVLGIIFGILLGLMSAAEIPSDKKDKDDNGN